jgi:hypothetical protein
MNQVLLLIFFFCFACSGCYETNTNSGSVRKKPGFVYKETIVTGNDTGMIRLGGFKRINISDILCQRWQLENGNDISEELIADAEMNKSFVREIVLFKDSSVLVNPMNVLQVARWHIASERNMKQLILAFPDQKKRKYNVEHLSSTSMKLRMQEVQDYLLHFTAPAQTHQNYYNDPFHPKHNQWRIKPLSKETDSAIHARVKNCILFFALYFRDHIKREAKSINFRGLPTIFKWYNGGVGLPDKNQLDDSWINCFYNPEQALKGYSILRKLIVDYAFSWPVGAPNWLFETHSVLEQMYHKVDDLKSTAVNGNGR